MTPPCPFRVIEDDTEWSKLVSELYPRQDAAFRTDTEEDERTYYQQELMLKGNQYKDLFDMDYKGQRSYVINKLI